LISDDHAALAHIIRGLTADARGPFSGGSTQFAIDSPLEGDGFELPVPREKKSRNLGIPLEFN
jgi:hypothetical protein